MNLTVIFSTRAENAELWTHSPAFLWKFRSTVHLRVWLCDHEARDTFTLFDTVGDEKIEAKDIGEVVRALGLNPTESDVRKFSNQTDTSKFIY
ncbi:hypothetical protein EG68_11885 [Paragonimus skrjabini miyazakii]|uniref:EF-hand domain-containing protein n=1 Tax=Paragonimus skrjabini miyazakii TaxID=59628 RepID=A0A8S9YD69_9TREM|nr:hypothetical protein EG68_11885 [Paragonimus skrjabini miyazakii]